MSQQQNEIKPGSSLVAYCGLYCGACRSYLKGRCPGCHDNEKTTWCKIRDCCKGNQYSSCADCKEYSDPDECRFFNNFMSKVFAFIFGSNRPTCIQRIKEIGIQVYADNMAKQKLQSIRKK